MEIKEGCKMELNKKKLGKMIAKILKGKLILSENSKEHKTMFKTLCAAYNNTMEVIAQPIIQAPPTLRPPTVITTTTTTTMTIKNPSKKITINIRPAGLGEIVSEIKNDSLFLKYQERAEMENLKPFEQFDGNDLELMK